MKKKMSKELHHSLNWWMRIRDQINQLLAFQITLA
jgi:hypothetical protein